YVTLIEGVTLAVAGELPMVPYNSNSPVALIGRTMFDNEKLFALSTTGCPIGEAFTACPLNLRTTFESWLEDTNVFAEPALGNVTTTLLTLIPSADPVCNVHAPNSTVA